MPSRGRPRGFSQSNLNTVSDGRIRRSSNSRGPRASLTLRRSARLSNLFVTNQGDLFSEQNIIGAEATDDSPQTCTLIPDQQNEEPDREHLPETPQAVNPRNDFHQHSGSQPARRCIRRQIILTQQDHLMNGDILQTNNPYIMRIVIEPPHQARPGDVLTPPLVMSLENESGRNSPEQEPVDPTLLWAVVSVVSEDNITSLAPPRTDLLMGTIADSVHPLTPPDHERQIGFVAFPNLVIREPGRYRLRVSLIKMNAIGDMSIPSYEGGTAVQSMSSRVIDVAPTAEPLTPGLSPVSHLTRKQLTQSRKRGARFVGSIATTWIAAWTMSMPDA
ncbi:hypothetical protein MMC18_001098 [Xylographa bjoerkii]|nr:hypothetical protein [Xylographa bjoerkii]